MTVPPARRSLRPLCWSAALLTLYAAAAWSFPGMSAKGGPEGGKPTPVTVTTAARGNLDIFLNGLGTAIPANTVLVKSRVDGQLLRVHFKEGQQVRAGDLLAEIDPRPFQVQLTQAQGQLARDTALLENARIDLERYRTLWSQDSIAKQQVDAQEALVRQYEGVVEADRGQVENAKLQLVYAKVTAPISGRVGLRQVDPGNIVGTTDSIVLITQTQPITVVFTLPEDNLPRVIGRLRSDEPVAVIAYDRQQKIKLANGSLLTVDNQIDTSTGTVKLKAQFRNADGALFPNQFVNVRMLINTLRDVVLVPVAAVQRGAQGNFVYLVKPDNTVQLRPVQVGDTEGDQVVVVKGLQAGETVVLEGIDKLREGARVEAVAKKGAAPQSPKSIEPPAVPRRPKAV